MLGLLFAGSFLEPAPAILILTPLLLPIVETAGINAIHFGIIMAVNLSNRPLHAAVRIEPVRREGGLQRADGHDLSRRAAVRGGQFPGAARHHLFAGDLDGAGRGAQ